MVLSWALSHLHITLLRTFKYLRTQTHSNNNLVIDQTRKTKEEKMLQNIQLFFIFKSKVNLLIHHRYYLLLFNYILFMRFIWNIRWTFLDTGGKKWYSIIAEGKTKTWTFFSTKKIFENLKNNIKFNTGSLFKIKNQSKIR
jgi:hypothetical protein